MVYATGKHVLMLLLFITIVLPRSITVHLVQDTKPQHDDRRFSLVFLATTRTC